MVTNPWALLPAKPPYILKEDREVVATYNSRARPEQRIDLNLHPFPFLGSPDANIVLLNYNPGIDPEDDQQQSRAFCEAHRANLQHAKLPFLFFLLDPSNRLHPGYGYWTKYLGQLIRLGGAQHLSQNLLVLECVPYPSVGGINGALELPSTSYAVELLGRALERGAVVIRLRQNDTWLKLTPELRDYAHFFSLRNRRQNLGEFGQHRASLRIQRGSRSA